MSRHGALFLIRQFSAERLSIFEQWKTMNSTPPSKRLREGPIQGDLGAPIARRVKFVDNPPGLFIVQTSIRAP